MLKKTLTIIWQHKMVTNLQYVQKKKKKNPIEYPESTVSKKNQQNEVPKSLFEQKTHHQQSIDHLFYFFLLILLNFSFGNDTGNCIHFYLLWSRIFKKMLHIFQDNSADKRCAPSAGFAVVFYRCSLNTCPAPWS